MAAGGGLDRMQCALDAVADRMGSRMESDGGPVVMDKTVSQPGRQSMSPHLNIPVHKPTAGRGASAPMTRRVDVPVPSAANPMQSGN
jgi:hypothetical protein